MGFQGLLVAIKNVISLAHLFFSTRRNNCNNVQKILIWRNPKFRSDLKTTTLCDKNVFFTIIKKHQTTIFGASEINSD